MAVNPLEARLVRLVKWNRTRKPGISDRDRSNEGRGRVALVTGASAGIGRAYATVLAAKGFRVVVLARRESKLKELQAELQNRFDANIDVLVCDLADPDAVATITTKLSQLGVDIDYLVNNAGFCLMGAFLDQPWEAHETVLRGVAVLPARLCHELMPTMVQKGWGRVVNVASVSGLYAGSPLMTMYSPAKSFLLKLTETLAQEYEEKGINVTCCIPGATATEFFEANRMATFGQTLKAQAPMMRPETVARQAYEACERKKRVIIHGWHHKILMVLAVHGWPKLRYGFVHAIAVRGVVFDD
jgi:uncharacterized protein